MFLFSSEFQSQSWSYIQSYYSEQRMQLWLSRPLENACKVCTWRNGSFRGSEQVISVFHWPFEAVQNGSALKGLLKNAFSSRAIPEQFRCYCSMAAPLLKPRFFGHQKTSPNGESQFMFSTLLFSTCVFQHYFYGHYSMLLGFLIALNRSHRIWLSNIFEGFFSFAFFFRLLFGQTATIEL